jgi:hypothetical protein
LRFIKKTIKEEVKNTTTLPKYKDTESLQDLDWELVIAETLRKMPVIVEVLSAALNLRFVMSHKECFVCKAIFCSKKPSARPKLGMLLSIIMYNHNPAYNVVQSANSMNTFQSGASEKVTEKKIMIKNIFALCFTALQMSQPPWRVPIKKNNIALC